MDIFVTETPDVLVEKAIDAGLDAHGKQLNVQAETLVPLQVQCRSRDGTLIGGLLGNTGDTWLHIWQFWVAEEWRNQSFGSQILAAAEDEAIRRKCRHAHLETLSFQGVSFYLDRGYEEYGVLQNYVGPHAQHFLRKKLIG